MRLLVAMLLIAMIMPIASAENVIKIGVIGPMETKYGTAMEHAVKLAADEINEHGGILGKKIEVVVADTKLDQNTATSEFRRLVVDEGCKVIIGGFSSGVALSMLDTMADLAREGHKVIWLGDASSPRLTDKVAQDYEHYKYFFRPLGLNASTFPLDMVAMLDFLRSQGLNIKKVAIIRDNALWTDDVMKVFKPLLEKHGYEIAMDEKAERGQTDFSSFLLKAQEKADVIVPILAHVRGDSLVKQWADMKIRIPIAGHDLSAIDPDYWKATDGKCFGEIYTADGGGVPIPINDKMKHFLDAYKAKYGHLPEAYSAYGCYDAVYLYKEAVEMAAKAGEKNPFDPDVLVKYLEKFNRTHPFEGVRGKIAFTKNHDLVWGDGFVRNWICQWQKGKQVVLYPKYMATGKLVLPDWIKPSGAKETVKKEEKGTPGFEVAVGLTGLALAYAIRRKRN